MSDNTYLTFALTKGRLAKQTLELLESIGITCEEMKDKDTRKLIFAFGINEKLAFLILLPSPWGKVPPSFCGGRRMRVTLPVFDRFRQPDKPQFETPL